MKILDIFILSSVSIITLLSSCSVFQPHRMLDPESHKVMMVVLADSSGLFHSKKDKITVKASATRAYTSLLHDESVLPGLEEKNEILAAIDNDIEPVYWNPSLLTVNYECLDESDIKKINTKYNKQPITYYNLSRPIFDKKRRYAFITIAYICGNLCGEGLSAILENINGKWVVISTFNYMNS